MDFKEGSPILNEDYLRNLRLNKVNDTETRTFSSSGTSILSTTQSFNANYDYTSSVKLPLKGFLIGMTQNFKLSMRYDYYEYINKYYSTLQSSRNLYRLSLPNYSSDLSQYKDNLSMQFLKDVSLLNSGNLIPRTLFQKYGTHLISSAFYGGSLEVYYSVFTNQINFTNQVFGEFNNAINVSFGNIGLNNNLELNFGSSSILSQANLKTGYYSLAKGGKAFTSLGTTNFQSSYIDWVNSINKDNSVITNFAKDGLIPLWEIIPDNFQSAITQLKAAYPYYLDNIYNDNIIENYDVHKYSSGTISLPEKIIRIDEKIITDKGIFKNHVDEIDIRNLFDLNTLVLYSNNFKRFAVQIYMTVSEIDDGYQRIYLYNSDNTQLFYQEFEHGPGFKKTEPSEYNFNTELMNISSIINNKLYIRYDAAGSFSDDWKSSDLKIILNFF